MVCWWSAILEPYMSYICSPDNGLLVVSHYREAFIGSQICPIFVLPILVCCWSAIIGSRAGFAFCGAHAEVWGPLGLLIATYWSLICQFCFVKYTFDKRYHVVERYNVTNCIHSTWYKIYFRFFVDFWRWKTNHPPHRQNRHRSGAIYVLYLSSG